VLYCSRIASGAAAPLCSTRCSWRVLHMTASAMLDECKRSATGRAFVYTPCSLWQLDVDASLMRRQALSPDTISRWAQCMDVLCKRANGYAPCERDKNNTRGSVRPCAHFAGESHACRTNGAKAAMWEYRPVRLFPRPTGTRACALRSTRRGRAQPPFVAQHNAVRAWWRREPVYIHRTCVPTCADVDCSSRMTK